MCGPGNPEGGERHALGGQAVFHAPEDLLDLARPQLGLGNIERTIAAELRVRCREKGAR